MVKADRDNQKVVQDSQTDSHPLDISSAQGLSSSSSSDSVSEVDQDDELAERNQRQQLDEDDTDVQFCTGSSLDSSTAPSATPASAPTRVRRGSTVTQPNPTFDCFA